MINTDEVLGQELAKFAPSAPRTGPLTIDVRLAVSALQKAIRRGNEAEALSCARLLADKDPQRLWRRLAVIAMEDVGIGDFDVIANTIFASRSKVWRDKQGGDGHVASYLVSRLCAAPKSRGTDDLGLVAEYHPDFEEARADLACAPQASLCDLVADPSQSIVVRSLAGVYLAGTDRWSVNVLPHRRGHIRVVLELYDHVGVPDYVCEAIDGGAKKERGILPVNLGLMWLQAAASTSRHIRDESASLTHLGVIDGVSSEAYDMHTQLGRRALGYFSKACEPVREYLLRFVKERHLYEVLVGLAWQAESSLDNRRLVYDGSEDLFEMAKVASIAFGEFPAERVDEAIGLMRDHLPDLHRARLRVLER